MDINILLELIFRPDTFLVVGMLRKLVEIVPGIVIAFDDNRPVRRKAYIPADKANLRNNQGSLGTHLQDLVPHWENKSLKDSTCHGMLFIKDLGLIDREICDLTGLLIHRGSHSAVIEIINTVSVVTESAARTCDMNLAVTLDGNESYRVDRIRIDRTYCRVLDDHFFKEMRTFLVNQSLIDLLCRLSLAIDLLDGLAAGTEVSLGHEEIMTVDEIYYFLFVVFSDLYPFTTKEFAKQLVELYFIINEIRIVRIVVSLDQIVITASGDICVALGIIEVIHLIEPVIHITCSEFPSAMDHVEKYPHTGFPALFVDILYLGIHSLIIHARHAPYKILQIRHR